MIHAESSKTLESSAAFVPLSAEVKILIALAFQRAAKSGVLHSVM